MNINDFIITFAKALKADYFFKNIKIIKPFENVSYAGEIKNTFVCVGLDLATLASGLQRKHHYVVKIFTDFIVSYFHF